MKKNPLYDPKKHFVSLEHGDAVKQICQDFFQQHNLNTFIYGRWYDDGTLMSLCDSSEWYDHYWQRGYKPSAPYDEDLKTQQSYIALWKGIHYEEVVGDAINFFDIDNPIAIVTRHEGYYESVNFAASKNNQNVVNFYMNNLDLLINFGREFVDKATDIIELGEANKIVIPDELRSELRGLSEEEVIQFDLQKRTFQHNSKNIVLTSREYDCLKLVASGFTDKLIAVELDISPRTVETYLNKVKQKFDCAKRSDLVKLIRQKNWLFI